PRPVPGARWTPRSRVPRRRPPGRRGHCLRRPERPAARDGPAGPGAEQPQGRRPGGGDAAPGREEDEGDAADAGVGAYLPAPCAAYFVPTGTAATALALAALCQSYHSVICHADAHVQTDECGAPEYAARGIKLVPVAGSLGKLGPEAVRRAAAQHRDVHSHKP